MYRDITEQCRQAINGSSRTFTASFLCGENKYSDIKSLKISVPFALSGKVNIGDTISKSAEIVISNTNILLGSKIEVFESVKLDSGEYEDIPMGKFTVSKATTKDSVTTIEADGPLSTETGLGYFSELVYPATTIQMLNEISSFIGVVIETDGLEEITVSSKPEGYTYREVIGYIAALHGTNAVETRDGAIALKWYEDCEEDIFTDKIDSPELENDLFVIEKFECVQEDTSIIKGTGFTGISISNPLMTEEIADLIWNKISGFSYRPGTFSIKSGTPCVDSWDSFVYNDERVIGAELEYIYDGGLQNTYKSVGESITSSASKGPLTQQMDRYYADLLLVKAAMVDTLTVNEADIRYLKADSISAITLVVKEAAIAELSADFVTAETVEANYANITLSNVEKSTIGTLFADIGLITDATIVDGHVTGFLDAVEVNANNVTAGTLSVDRLVFRGSEKSIIYELNNITGALQAVQSETLNGEILTDRSITVDKIVAKSITANEIASATITANELAANCITADKIVSSAITSAKIATGAITAEKIASKTITADKINVNDLFAQDITATGTISGATLLGGSLQTSDENGTVIHDSYYSRYMYSDDECHLVVSPGGIGFYSVEVDGISKPCNAKFYSNDNECVSISEIGINLWNGSNNYQITNNGEGILNYIIANAVTVSGNATISNTLTASTVEANTGVFQSLTGSFIVPIANGGTGLSSTIKFYDNPTQLGVNKSTATLDTIISAMATVWGNSEVRFWTNTGTEYPNVNAEVLAGAKTCGFTGTSIYGNVTITRINNEWTVKFEDYSNTRRVYVRRYTKTNSLGWSTWQQVVTNNGDVSILGNLTTSGGALSGWISIPNGSTIYSATTTGESVRLIDINTSNNMHINNGTVKADLYLHSSTQQINFHANSFYSNTSKGIAFGTSNRLWGQIYSSNATISTSDRNEKDNIKKLTEIHKKFFMKLIPVSFTFKDGTSGRTHIGFISQDVEDAMTELGMTSLDFAGFCKDIKTVDVLDGNGDIHHTENVVDEYGNHVYIYSLRYEEFIGIIAYVLQDTVNRLDIVNTLQQNMLNRIATLEAKLVNMAA